METTIEIFLCYAHEDEEYRQQLEKQLSFLQRNGRIRLWHNGNINPGEAQEQVTLAHLNTAQIVLLLVSSNFMASNYCYRMMEKALERQKQEKIHVIPIIVSPVEWQDGPLKGLQALPKNGKPVRSWRPLDAAFFEVAKGIRHAIEEIKTQSLVFPLSSQQPENSEKTFQHSGVLERKSLSGEFLAEPEVHEEPTDLISPEGLSQSVVSRWPKAARDKENQFGRKIPKRKYRNLYKKRLFVTLAILLVLVFPLFSFLPRPLCFATFCHFSQQPIKQVSPQNEGEVHDQNLLVQFIGTQQNTFALPGNPLRLSPNQLSKQGAPALCIDQSTQQSVFRITIGISNLRQDQYTLVIKQVQLIVESITFIPRPLYAVVQSLPRLSNYNLYHAIYRGQNPNTLILAKYDNPPYDYVSLTPHETDKISVQVASLVEVFLSFPITITYLVVEQTHTLTLLKTFQVIFSDKSNWHPYQQLRDGHFTQLDTP